MSTPTTSAGTILAPGTNTGWNRTAYAAGWERATYQRMILVPFVEDGERLLGGMVVRKAARVVAATQAQTSDGTGVTYVNPMAAAVTVSPVSYIVPIGWSETEDAQVDLNLDQIAGDSCSRAIAEAIEAATAANFQSGTQFVVNPTLDAPTLRGAIAKLVTNTNGEGMPDGPNRIYGYFAANQMPTLNAIPEVNNAQFRGDSENPYVKGLWVKGFGLLANISTVVAQDANGFHNAVFLAASLTVRWNVRSRIKRQDYEYRNGYYGFANVGSQVVHDLRMVPIRTT